MAYELLICQNQNEITSPFVFKATGIKVFSIEEALFHCFHNWKQNFDDICGADFTTWVSNTLEQKLLAEKLSAISLKANYGERLMAFLTVVDYFDNKELVRLSQQVMAWEKRKEWQKLKDKADLLMEQNEPERALSLYNQAIAGNSEEPLLYNNAGIALMRLGRADMAAASFKKALGLAEPRDFDRIRFHLAEALILNGDLDEAQTVLGDALSSGGESADYCYLRGELESAASNFREAIGFFERSLELNEDPETIYRLSELYIKTRQFDKSGEVLERVKVKDSHYLKHMAENNIIAGNIPAAIKNMERAMLMDVNSPEVWTRLASYHRQDYDLVRAGSAIAKALTLAPNDKAANLEAARIRKAQGRTKEYQTLLRKLLGRFKKDYRDVTAD